MAELGCPCATAQVPSGDDPRCGLPLTVRSLALARRGLPVAGQSLALAGHGLPLAGQSLRLAGQSLALARHGLPLARDGLPLARDGLPLTRHALAGEPATSEPATSEPLAGHRSPRSSARESGLAGRGVAQPGQRSGRPDGYRHRQDGSNGDLAERPQRQPGREGEWSTVRLRGCRHTPTVAPPAVRPLCSYYAEPEEPGAELTGGAQETRRLDTTAVTRIDRCRT
jgi:hypothetical protein